MAGHPLQRLQRLFESESEYPGWLVTTAVFYDCKIVEEAHQCVISCCLTWQSNLLNFKCSHVNEEDPFHAFKFTLSQEVARRLPYKARLRVGMLVAIKASEFLGNNRWHAVNYSSDFRGGWPAH